MLKLTSGSMLIPTVYMITIKKMSKCCYIIEVQTGKLVAYLQEVRMIDKCLDIFRCLLLCIELPGTLVELFVTASDSRVNIC